MVKLPSWKPEAGNACTVLAENWKGPITRSIMQHGGIDYPSEDLKKGISSAHLMKPNNLEILKSGLSLDPRGGYFAPMMIDRTVKKIVQADDELGKKLSKIILINERGSVTELMKSDGFLVRVMFSHFRHRVEQFREIPDPELVDVALHPPQLVELYNLMSRGAPPSLGYTWV